MLAVVVNVTTLAERMAPPAVMVRASVPLVRYLMRGVMNPAGWLFSQSL